MYGVILDHAWRVARRSRIHRKLQPIGGRIYGEAGGLTVRNAVPGIQKKLGFNTKQHMVVRAVRVGLENVKLP